MRVVNIDAKSHLAKTPENFLQEARRAKKKIYLEACLQKCRYFSSFIASVNRLLGVEATATLKKIASCLTKIGGNPIHSRADTSRKLSPSL